MDPRAGSTAMLARRALHADDVVLRPGCSERAFSLQVFTADKLQSAWVMRTQLGLACAFVAVIGCSSPPGEPQGAVLVAHLQGGRVLPRMVGGNPSPSTHPM